MRTLNVHYCGWGEDWLLGTLAEDDSTILFEYSPQALAQGLELSPLHLALRPRGYAGFPPFLHRLPGVIADSLPDGWGLLLMDRLFRQQGLRHPTPLDRLAFIADRAMGALRFVPAAKRHMDEPDWTLLTLAQASAAMLEGDASDVLNELALTGGSPQGARPKALVQHDVETGQVSTRVDAPGTPWMVKFPAQGEHPEVCAIEQLYAALARDCGLEVSASALFSISPQLAAFAVERFDRKQHLRIPVHSLAGLLHVDFRLPGSADYTAFLRATRLLTRDAREVKKAYALTVFNVLFHNRDDHPKNFAWCLGEDRRWRLSPAFDLTFSDGPMGQHHMDVCGEGRTITRSHLLRLALEGGLSTKEAEGIIEQMLEQALGLSQRLAGFPVRHATAQRLKKVVTACSDGLM